MLWAVTAEIRCMDRRTVGTKITTIFLQGTLILDGSGVLAWKVNLMRQEDNTSGKLTYCARMAIVSGHYQWCFPRLIHRIHFSSS